MTTWRYFPVLAILIGTGVSCTKPAYLTDQGDLEPIEEFPVEIPSVPELSPREQLLALRESVRGTTVANVSVETLHFPSAKLVSIDDQGVELIPEGGKSMRFSWSSISEDLRHQWGFDSSIPLLRPLSPESDIDAEPKLVNHLSTPEERAADAQFAARKQRVRAAIDEINEKIADTEAMIQEAQSFQSELSRVYAAEDDKKSQMQAARIYSRMNVSTSCGNCAPPPPKARIGGISTSQADRDKVMDSLQRRIQFYERNLTNDQSRLEQLLAYENNLDS